MKYFYSFISKIICIFAKNIFLYTKTISNHFDNINAMEKFSIQDNEYNLTLSNKKHIYSEVYDELHIATNLYGIYIPNIIHNYRTGMYCLNKNKNTYEVLIPFIYKNIVRFKFPYSYHDEEEGYCPYYIARYEIQGRTYYSVYIEDGHPFICLAKFIPQKIVISRRLRYIQFFSGKKVGIIRNCSIIIPPKYTSIYGYRLTIEGTHLCDSYGAFDDAYKVFFIVSLKGKKGLFLENKEILPTEYDYITVEEESGVCTLVKNDCYYLGSFEKKNLEFTMIEISEEELIKPKEETINNADYGYEWTEEDTWIALTDGQYGPYHPERGIDWDTLDDIQGR